MNIRKAVLTTFIFFKKRFPEKNIEFEISCGYFGEWVERFMTTHPEGYMDNISLAIWEEIKK